MSDRTGICNGTKSTFHWYRKSGADIEVSQILKMESFASRRQAVLPDISGYSHQPGSGFGFIISGVRRVALSFASKSLLPAMKNIGKDLFNRSMPEFVVLAKTKTREQQPNQ